MVEPVSAPPIQTTDLQKTANNEQENIQRQQETVRETAPISEDSVEIRSTAITSQDPTVTSIQNTDQAQETASRVASLIQQQPELAVTAQGGQITPEKVDIAIQANIGGVA